MRISSADLHFSVRTDKREPDRFTLLGGCSSGSCLTAFFGRKALNCSDLELPALPVVLA